MNVKFFGKWELVTMFNFKKHVMLAWEMFVLKSSDLTGHTQSRGLSFAASLNNYIG